ncbi:MAG: site-specific integrase [Desulfuromonadales bacterium]|nr:MAG: site-specific integrase [Desulfuromonadales bacterium]
MAKAFEKLTRPAMRKLMPGAKINEHGITFERLGNGDGVFTVNIMVDGQRIHRVIGRESDGTTRTQAEEFIEKVRRDAREDRLALPKGRKIALSFEEAAEKYLHKLEEEGGNDLAAKRRRLNQHLVPFFGGIPLSKISAFDVERYKKQRSQEKAIPGGEKQKPKDESRLKLTSQGTINRELAVLSHLFNKAIEWGWGTGRPAKIKRFKEGQGRITYLTVDQIKRLIDCAKQDQSPQVYPFIVIGLETSMRKMEILSIRREHVDLQRKIIFIPKAKAGMREQPITTHLAEFLEGYLAALPKGTPWLFPSVGAKEGHSVDIRKPYRRVVVAAGLDPDAVVRHTLRHTAITHLVQAGVDLPTVKRISGHKTLIMVERYAHQNGAHISAAMDKLEKRIKVAG